jgi:hypothetical protein
MFFDHMIMSDSDGRSGGLLMLWRNDLNVTSSRVHNNYLDIRIDEGSNVAWRISGIYGEPRGDQKHLTWGYMRDLKAMVDLPWVLLGDFNEILIGAEKEGGNLRPQRCMQAFRGALSDCNLEDLGYVGDQFTWRRGRMRERLDRAVSDQRWNSMFPLAGLIHEDYKKSDHRPITLDSTYLESANNPRLIRKKFFEARWLLEESFDSTVNEAWASAQLNGYGSLAEKLQDVHAALHVWDREILKKPRQRLDELQRELNEVMDGPLSNEATARQRSIQLEMENLHEQEEVKWVQRSRANWMKYGDRNTNFFHNFASARKKKNLIKKLKSESGDWIED